VHRVEGGPDGPAGVQHVVHQHHHLAGEVRGDLGHRGRQHRAQPDVVAVEGHVQRALGRRLTVDLGQGLGQPGGEGDPAGLEPDEDHVLQPVVVLDDLVRHSPERPADVVGVEHLGAGNENAPERGRDSAFSFCQSGTSPSLCPSGARRLRFTVRTAG
jgi:hypothetical protein